MRSIDINADLGEGGPHDPGLMKLASSANISCGGHAGNETTIRSSIELALARRVAIGAHPGYEDPEHFGRRPLDLPLHEVSDLVSRQLERFARIASELGASIHHVKPHGALYNQANASPDLATALVTGISRVLTETTLYVPHDGALSQAARDAGHTAHAEGFADRRYLPTGALVPRGHERAVIRVTREAVLQATDIAANQRVSTLEGTPIGLPAKTLCVHGDGDSATTLLTAIREALENAGFTIAAP